MAITVQYGPIGAALGLAQVAGQGQGFNIQSQRDLQALQMQDQIQRTINQQAQSEIQNALAYRELEAKNQLAQQQMSQQEAYKNAQLQLDQQQMSQRQQQFNTEQQTREEQAKSLTELRQQQQQEKQMRETWLNSLSPDQRNTVMSGGHLPTQLELDQEQRRVNSDTTDAQYKRANALHEQITALQKQLDPLSGLSDEDRAIVGQRLKAAMNDYSTTIDGINAATGSRKAQGAMNQQGNPPAARTPNGGNSPQIPPHWAAAAEQAVGPDVRKQLEWIKQHANELSRQDGLNYQGEQPGGGSLQKGIRGEPQIPSRFFSENSTSVRG